MNALLQNQYKFISGKWFVFCFITCIALGLRLHHLDHESLFMDEIHQVSYYKGTFSEITQGSFRIQQPPLDCWIGAFFYQFSESDYMARLPSALWGTGSILLIMLLINTFASWPVVAFTGLAMALNPYHIYFSQEARPYSIAIFFLLSLLTSLYSLIGARNPKKTSYLIFFILCFLFLMSRTLSPLSTFVSLGLIVFIRFLFELRKKDYQLKFFLQTEHSRYIHILIIQFIALLCYMPFFIIILANGQRYLDSSETFGPDLFISKLSNFSFNDIIQAWVVQLEPFAMLFFILYLFSILFIIFENDKKKFFLVRIIIILLPLCLFIHYTVFRLNTSFPFRPPYAIYLLPLVLIASSYSLEKIKLLVVQNFKKSSAIIGIISCAFLLVISTITLHDFKTFSKKSNWRDVGKYLSENYGSESLIIFSSLEPDEHWPPVFYGFNRYYDGQSQKISITQLEQVKHQLIQTDLRPVLLMFHYRDYFLTSHSQHTFHPGVREEPFQWQFSKWPHELDLISFTGFSIITINEKNQEILHANTADQIHYMIDNLIPAAPQDSALVEQHLTSFILTPDEFTQHKRHHLLEAKKLSRPDQYKLFEDEKFNLADISNN